jgi:general secretion pathway protein A
MTNPTRPPAQKIPEPATNGTRDSAAAEKIVNLNDFGQTSAGWRQRPLYGAFYGLEDAPFDLTPNPRFLFLSTRQREALGNLRYALATSKGFTLILGEAGTGKTTLVRTALAEIGDSPAKYVLVNNPTLGRDEFYEFMAREFGLSAEARVSKTRFLSELQRDVEARFAQGGLTGLVVDEAQSMPHALLEEIRLLGNIETSTAKLLNIVRVALRCQLKPLTLDETAAYISGRLRIAGGTPGEIFTRETVIMIHHAATGIPRTINVLCDNALIGGFAAQVKPVSVEIVEDVCRDFDLLAGAVPETQASSRMLARSPMNESRQLPEPSPSMDERQVFGAMPPKSKRRFTFFS